MKQVKKRLLGIVLALVMAMSFIPAMPVSANDKAWLYAGTETGDDTQGLVGIDKTGDPTTFAEGMWVEKETEHTVTAKPAEGYAFKEWRDYTHGNTVISTNPSYTLTVSDDISLVAFFETAPVTITYNAIVNDGDSPTRPQLSSGYKFAFCAVLEDTNKNQKPDDAIMLLDQETLEALAAQVGMTVEEWIDYASSQGTTIRTSFRAGYNYIFYGQIRKSDNTNFPGDNGDKVTGVSVIINGVDKTKECEISNGCIAITSDVGIAYTCPSNDIEVNSTNFPDPVFREFVKKNIGNKDDYLSQSEINAVKSIDVFGCEIEDLTGIEFFTELEELVCDYNNLKSLDVSSNTKLKLLSCEENKLEYIDVSNNPALTDLDCANNQLTDLDVSKNAALTDLCCAGNQLTDLDVSKNTLLDNFVCNDNLLNVIYTAKEKDSFSRIQYDNGVEVIVLTESDWNSKVEWKVSESDPSLTTAVVWFECTKTGAEDYKISKPMTVKVNSTKDATCEKDGSVSYEATLPAKDSRTGNKIVEEKTVISPATGHKWGEWKVTVPAMVGKDGVETRICANDKSHKETRAIKALTPTPTPTSKPTAKPTATPTGAAKPTSAATVSIKLDKTAVNVTCGKTANLKATLKGATGKIAWTSSDNKIATVDANGKITAKQAGNVTITATAAGKSASCEVTVLYKDVTNTKDFWYAPTNYLTAKGVVKGYEKQTLFKPANDCTRAQMLTFMWRLQGEPAPKAKTCKFPDVKKTDYFFKPVIWAVEQGITTGYKDGTFKPQNVCTRAQTVTFLWRMAKTPKAESSKNPFSDVKKSDYFYNAVLWASGKKIVAGYSDGTFKPQGKCLRRQMVTFLYKYDKFVNGKG